MLAALPYPIFDNAGELASILARLEDKELLTGASLTKRGRSELDGYRVSNAIILAGGGAAKNSKSIYSLPKGLYVKDGETLIERQIRQLREAGIDDITVVVGYRQELYFFLEEKYGVELVCTPSPTKGNVVSLNEVADRLSRTYVCCCDNYFAENPFSAWEYDSFHATVRLEDAAREMKVVTNRSGRILRLYASKEPGECLYGHAFLDETFSRRLREFMADELDVFRVDSLFWEELAARHSDDLDIYARRYSSDFIFEFDSIRETQSVETLFINGVSDKIISRICGALSCGEADITDINVLDVGMTNINVTFKVGGRKYIVRYPGESSWDLVSRRREVKAQGIATELGLDSSCVYIDEDGCKIALFREGMRDLSGVWFKNQALMEDTVRRMRRLHDATAGMADESMDFDPVAEGDRLMGLASARKGDLDACFGGLRSDAARLAEFMERDGYPKVLSHHDWKYDNILITDDTYDVIDWEYGMLDDPGSDLMRVLGGYPFGSAGFDSILAAYLGHEPSECERMHFVAAFSPIGYYWLGWLMYQESRGEECGFWTIWYYERAVEAARIALPYYEGLYK